MGSAPASDDVHLGPGVRNAVGLLTSGVLGVSAPVDPRRPSESFDVMGVLEEQGPPYAVALGDFDAAAASHDPDEVRDPLPSTPPVRRDARDRVSSTGAPIAPVEYLMTRSGELEPV